jgi:hypothetical protein
MRLPNSLILDVGAEGTPPVYEWPPPEIPDSVGPSALGLLLCHYRAFLRAKRTEVGRSIDTLADISDDGLKRLIRFAYQASFFTDEGRAIRTRIAVRRERMTDELEKARTLLASSNQAMAFLRSWGGLFSPALQQIEDYRLNTCRFDPPLRIDSEKVLAKCAPVVLPGNGAISVQEQSEELVATGIAVLDGEDEAWDLLNMPRLHQPTAALLIEVLGPGHLRVREGKVEFTLFADRLVNHSWAFGLDPVARWLHEVSMRLATELKSRPGFTTEAGLLDELDRLKESDLAFPHTDLVVFFGRLLRTASGLGHGGAFAFVPRIESAPINIKYPLQSTDFAEQLVNVWEAHCAVWQAARRAGEGVLEVAANKRSQVQFWLRMTRTAAQLSAADGCVVFDRDLKLRGYGGIIRDLQPTLGRCVDLVTGKEVSSEELLKNHGTRHLSAYNLCRMVPGAIVFMLSQDGDLKLFASDQSTVYFAASLHP